MTRINGDRARPLLSSAAMVAEGKGLPVSMSCTLYSLAVQAALPAGSAASGWSVVVAECSGLLSVPCTDVPAAVCCCRKSVAQDVMAVRRRHKGEFEGGG